MRVCVSVSVCVCVCVYAGDFYSFFFFLSLSFSLIIPLLLYVGFPEYAVLAIYKTATYDVVGSSSLFSVFENCVESPALGQLLASEWNINDTKNEKKKKKRYQRNKTKENSTKQHKTEQNRTEQNGKESGKWPNSQTGR